MVMTMWARVDNDGTVAEITDIDPTGRFHPSIQWVACGIDVETGWTYGGETFSPPPPEPLDQLAEQQRREINTSRDAAFAAGMTYDFPDGTTDAVQTRPEDKANLLGIAIEARDLRDAGITDPVIEFRGASNETHALTADQAIAMTNAALAHIKAIYEQSWQRKDAIDANLAEETLTYDEKRAAIEAITW